MSALGPVTHEHDIRLSHALAWAAGFFDGEGNTSFYLTKRGVRHVFMGLSQTTIEPLERFQNAISNGQIYGPYIRKRSHEQPLYQGRLYRINDIKEVLDKLLPYLCSIKIQQANEALRRYELY